MKQQKMAIKASKQTEWGTTSYCRIHYVLCGPSAAASTWHVTKTNVILAKKLPIPQRGVSYPCYPPPKHLCLAFVCCGSALVNFTVEIASVFTVHSGNGASHRQRHSQLPVTVRLPPQPFFTSSTWLASRLCVCFTLFALHFPSTAVRHFHVKSPA